VTRGRVGNHAWVPDPTGTADPADALAQIIERPPNHESALAVHERLHREAGVEPPGAERLLRGPSSDIGIGL
jgi:hypothetical protein